MLLWALGITLGLALIWIAATFEIKTSYYDRAGSILVSRASIDRGDLN
jgi:hypothetical protein